jgi:hypothetical protein
MSFYLVFELQPEKYLKPGGYVGTPPESAYEDRMNPLVVGFYEVDDGTEACIQAARETRRLGNYVAVEGTPMSIDFTAKPQKSLKAGKKRKPGEKMSPDELSNLEAEVLDEDE